MSTVTIAGLPVLAIIEDHHADATGNVRPGAEEIETPVEELPRGTSKRSAGGGSRGRDEAHDAAC